MILATEELKDQIPPNAIFNENNYFETDNITRIFFAGSIYKHVRFYEH